MLGGNRFSRQSPQNGFEVFENAAGQLTPAGGESRKKGSTMTLEQLGIVLGIIASIVAIAGGIGAAAMFLFSISAKRKSKRESKAKPANCDAEEHSNQPSIHYIQIVPHSGLDPETGAIIQ